ncbi:calcitonin-like receptor [Plakobranchus ocellatus]|uniref:Calcitonin-like receptor n=1 Tax=Plakobranchus ocellatus TaxID=259542 RepID=A0AAV3YPM1_9GAST|nr:calcitonin-like receptor [Plakobranchus ocellatus]
MACIGTNLLFLCNILRILLTQLSTHPNEPSNFRRALKATFVLIPLFGVQLFVSIYPVRSATSFGVAYEKFAVFSINSQGFFVALIFCFFNGEVRRLYGRGSLGHWDMLQHSRRTSSTLQNTPSLVSRLSIGMFCVPATPYCHSPPRVSLIPSLLITKKPNVSFKST